METADRSFSRDELGVKKEEQVEKLVAEIGQVIRAAEPERRAGLKELAETLLHEEIVTIGEEPRATAVESPRARFNPLAPGILLAVLGFALALVIPFVGLTLAGIGVLLVLWGGVLSVLKK